MTANALSVLCANCGGDEFLSRLVKGTTACPWCGLSFHDDLAPPGEPRPIFLSVILIEPTAARMQRAEATR
jgi:hypothetical protein